MTSIPRSALLLLALLALFWGANWPILKLAVREAPVFWFRLVCVLGSGLGLTALAVASRQSLAVPRGERLRLAWVALFSIVGWNVFSGFGVLLLPAGRASMLGYTMPLWLAILSLFMLREPVHRRNLLGLAMGMTGVALLIGEDAAAFTRAPVGTLCMLAAAFSWALGVALIKRRPFSIAPTVQTAWMMFAGSLPLALLALLYGGLSVPAISITAWLAVAYNIFVAGVLCYWAFYKLVNLLPASVTGISSLSVPVIGVLTGVLFLGETPTWRDWTALALIVGALCLVLLLQPRELPARPIKKRDEISGPSH
jgi:drug/metabolite transporter (DMT)-like permease